MYNRLATCGGGSAAGSAGVSAASLNTTAGSELSCSCHGRCEEDQAHHICVCAGRATGVSSVRTELNARTEPRGRTETLGDRDNAAADEGFHFDEFSRA